MAREPVNFGKVRAVDPNSGEKRRQPIKIDNSRSETRGGFVVVNHLKDILLPDSLLKKAQEGWVLKEYVDIPDESIEGRALSKRTYDLAAESSYASVQKAKDRLLFGEKGPSLKPEQRKQILRKRQKFYINFFEEQGLPNFIVPSIFFTAHRVVRSRSSISEPSNRRVVRVFELQPNVPIAIRLYALEDLKSAKLILESAGLDLDVAIHSAETLKLYNALKFLLHKYPERMLDIVKGTNVVLNEDLSWKCIDTNMKVDMVNTNNILGHRGVQRHLGILKDLAEGTT